jgi:hypothetical protein
MRGQRVHKDVLERVVRRAMGVEGRVERRTALVVGRQGYEAQHLALPEETETLVPIQLATGEFIFQIDGSLIDGPDPL